jgi:hypothetical protein
MPAATFVQRCNLHGSYAVSNGLATGCPWCRESAKNAKRHALDLVAAGLRCDECGTRLLRPARLCGFCSEEWDVDARLAELDHEKGPGRSTAAGPATPRENTS